MGVSPCTDRDGYKYQFRYNKQRYQGYYATEAQAILEEAKARVRLAAPSTEAAPAPVVFTTPVPVAAQRAGVAAMALSFNLWAGHKLAHERAKLEQAKHPRPQDEIERLIKGRELKLRIVLRFFGHRPEQEEPRMNRNTKTKDIRVYKGLSLTDVIEERRWIDEFEDYLTACGYDGQSKNNYRSTASGLYALAMTRKYRASGIQVNPFIGLERDDQLSRDVVPGEDDLRRVIKQAAPHLQLALLIALYAPELRVGSILALTWANIDTAMTTITVADHKNAGRRKGKKQVVPIIDRLRRILNAAKADPNRNPACPVIIQYQGRGIKSIHRAVQGACERCQPAVPYGLNENEGITFHSIRHFIGTQAAKMRMAKDDRKAILDHDSDAMADHYNHMTGEDTREPMEALGAQLDRILAGEVKLRYVAKRQSSKRKENVRTFARLESPSDSKTTPKTTPNVTPGPVLAYQKRL